MPRESKLAKDAKKLPSVADGEKAAHQAKLKARAEREAQLRKDKKMPKSDKPDPKVRGVAHQGHGKHGADKSKGKSKGKSAKAKK